MNSVYNWLGQTNPNLVLPVLGSVFMYLWHKAKGDKTANFRSLIDSVLHTFGTELLDAYNPATDVATFLANARATIEKKVWVVLAKRGVPRNSLTESWVHEAIEKMSAWLGNEAAKLRIPRQLDEAVARLEKADNILKMAAAQPPVATSP